MSDRDDLAALLDSMSDVDSSVVRAWLSDGKHVSALPLRLDHERVASGPAPSDDPRAIRTVGVIGGGTAGYLTALALRIKRPELDVTLIESSRVPIIGVGESTVPLMLVFLHNYLGIDPAELAQRVAPTWKLGIKFDWGPNPDGFLAPFDWEYNSVGMRGSLAQLGNINAATLQSLMMDAKRVPVYALPDGRHVSLMKHLPFSYHLDNGRFVAYLTELAARHGVRHVDAQIDDVRLAGEDWVDHLTMRDGTRYTFDMYVDCTGFRSMLLGKAFRTPFHSYADSLFTDSAVTMNRDHDGHLQPYTTATTMNAGWCWTIPTRENDHLGYVYSSAALPDDAAAAELAQRFPGGTPNHVVRFRVGRHDKAWRGNVMGIGNSYAFVEPLESTGLLMITWGVLSLVSTLPASWSQPHGKELVNDVLGERWDAIRWFLAAHYKFNTRLDTPFWKDVRENAVITGLQPLLDTFRAGAPLRFRDTLTRRFANTTAPTFYGLAGVDTILMGQQVYRQLLPPTEEPDAWHARKAAADALVRYALPHQDALTAFDTVPGLLRELFDDKDSWAFRDNPRTML